MSRQEGIRRKLTKGALEPWFFLIAHLLLKFLIALVVNRMIAGHDAKTHDPLAQFHKLLVVLVGDSNKVHHVGLAVVPADYALQFLAPGALLLQLLGRQLGGLELLEGGRFLLVLLLEGFLFQLHLLLQSIFLLALSGQI